LGQYVQKSSCLETLDDEKGSDTWRHYIIAHMDQSDTPGAESTGFGVATLCAHAGEPRSVDVGAGARSHVSPIYQHTVFDFPSVEASVPAMSGDGYVYRRNGMPNADELGAAVALLEGAAAGCATGSGMGAIVAAVLACAEAGDRVLVQRDAYGGTLAMFVADLGRLGLIVDTVDVYDASALGAAVVGARLLLLESISNPLLMRPDLAHIAATCRAAGVTVVVDNTFATPLAMRPLGLGADLVIHSATKFLSGHHDACAGAIAGSAELVTRAAGVSRRMGLVVAPFDAWLVVRGLRTLDVRMRRAWDNAALLAARLDADARVMRVYRARQCALVTFDLGSRAAADALVAACRVVTLSPSLGGVTTTLSHPASSSHVALGAEARAAAGIGDGLVRMCVGIDDPADVWADLAAALAS
jgi:cystathionine beta-lyase/cystathionine gamma-synthase